MAGLIFEIHVKPEDGEQFTVIADQRDAAAWELQSFGGPVAYYPQKVYTFCRFLAWSALKRAGKVKRGFDGWSATVEWAELFDNTELEGDESGDPGQTAPSAGT